MFVSRSPFRYRRRFALGIAIMASATWNENRVLGQSAADPITVAAPDDSEPTLMPEVVVTPLKFLPAGVVKSNDPAKTTFVFSPIEMGPIRRSVPEVALPPEIAARRSEVERKSLERVFAGGMITGRSNRGVQKIVRHPEFIVAMAPQETVLPQVPPQQVPPSQSKPHDEMIDADVLVDPPALSDPPLVGEEIPDLPKPVRVPTFESPQQMIPEETVPGMIEPKCPLEKQLPNFALPGGGLDVFQLAPTRFRRPLPNVH